MTLPELTHALAAGRNLVLLGRKIFLLEGIDSARPANSLLLRALESGAKYIGKPELVTGVLGSVDVDQLPWKSGDDRGEEDTKARKGLPSFTLQNGTRITSGTEVRLRNGKTATFVGYVPSRPKYPLEIEIGGRPFKCPADHILSVVRHALGLTAERKAELLKAFFAVEMKLEPEWLTADGERPRAQVELLRRELHAERSRIAQELGYVPTWEEAQAAAS